ncbi:hypothetical protein TSOC_012194 [Tetrabaena socialis]|uniref:Uncharacterized protein n=1 Tax=Tetrabaena socialis TaxID=47790 RepID=A0A2J7ZNN8_9CHLO|nr:hypothetical protein TSOC_012194 [Tetrabaena socialis]|eukprot:PNH01882.1 hypothetical protein TSOC_012194 [Tetrabaena socialis]
MQDVVAPLELLLGGREASGLQSRKRGRDAEGMDLNEEQYARRSLPLPLPSSAVADCTIKANPLPPGGEARDVEGDTDGSSGSSLLVRRAPCCTATDAESLSPSPSPILPPHPEASVEPPRPETHAPSTSEQQAGVLSAMSMEELRRGLELLDGEERALVRQLGQLRSQGRTRLQQTTAVVAAHIRPPARLPARSSCAGIVGAAAAPNHPCARTPYPSCTAPVAPAAQRPASLPLARAPQPYQAAPPSQPPSSQLPPHSPLQSAELMPPPPRRAPLVAAVGGQAARGSRLQLDFPRMPAAAPADPRLAARQNLRPAVPSYMAASGPTSLQDKEAAAQGIRDPALRGVMLALLQLQHQQR